MVKNTQRPIAADYADDGSILVHSIFPTIQGEGPHCGERAIFVRLSGCNLQCPMCDTSYTGGIGRMTPEHLVQTVAAFGWPAFSLLVLTGGEPFRQNVVPAVYELLNAGWRVQVETNGVLCPPDYEKLKYFKKFEVVCSPKTSAVNRTILDTATAFKYVIRSGEVDADDGLPTRALMHKATPKVARPRPGAPVFVQPMDEGDPAANARNLEATIESAMKFGHRLQIQVHKAIDVP